MSADGVLGLQHGRSTLRVTLEPGEEAPAAIVTLVIMPTADYVSVPGKIRVRYQDVEIGTFDLNMYSNTVLNLTLRSFKTDTILTVDAEFQRPRRRFSASLGLRAKECAVVRESYSVALEDEIANRSHLIDAAREMSGALGLSGDYLTQDRIEFLNEGIGKALSEGTGYSAVRLGDGEGRLLAYRHWISDAEILTQLLYYQFGPQSMHLYKTRVGEGWIGGAADFLRGLLVDSMTTSDVVGLPIAEYYRERPGGDRFGQLGYAGATILGPPLLRYCSRGSLFGTNVFQLAASRGAIFRQAAERAKSLTIVGPWDLTAELSQALHLSDVRLLRVPGHYTWNGKSGYGQFPDLYEKVVARIRDLGDVAGHLFFVGAGVLGKHYCNLLKQQNGTALDIGSVFDSWAKKGLPYAVRNERISLAHLSDDRGQ